MAWNQRHQAGSEWPCAEPVNPLDHYRDSFHVVRYYVSTQEVLFTQVTALTLKARSVLQQVVAAS